jgi:hypothetical protein
MNDYTTKGLCVADHRGGIKIMNDNSIQSTKYYHSSFNKIHSTIS